MPSFEEGRLSELLERAAGVRKIESEDLAPGNKVSIKRAVQNRVIYRWMVCHFLDEMLRLLGDAGVPGDALTPLESVNEHLKAIDYFGTEPPLFKGGGMPFGLTKPLKRLCAEGHAVGCAAYLHETVGLRKMDACKAVASLFSWVGHAGRSAKGKLSDAHRLSSKTVHQWYDQLELQPEPGNFGEVLRWLSKISAIEALGEAERKNPTADWPPHDARIKLAERMGNIAVQSLIGAPDGPKWTLKLNSELKPWCQTTG